jgi:hypothetical protein
VDLNTGIDPYGTPEAVAQAEILCQTSSGTVVQCAEAFTHGNVWNAATGETSNSGGGACGHANGPCSTGRNYFVLGSETFPCLTDRNCQSSLSSNIWATYGDFISDDVRTAIELPGSGQWVCLDSSHANDSENESTGHYYICS